MKLTVYYDGQCHLCSREIEMYRNKDVDNKIIFQDISLASFDAKTEHLNPEEVHKVFHVKNAKGELLKAVDGFIAIWDELDTFQPLSKMAKSKLIRPFFDLGYYSFAKIRPLLPKKECNDGTCRI